MINSGGRLEIGPVTSYAHPRGHFVTEVERVFEPVTQIEQHVALERDIMRRSFGNLTRGQPCGPPPVVNQKRRPTECALGIVAVEKGGRDGRPWAGVSVDDHLGETSVRVRVRFTDEYEGCLGCTSTQGARAQVDGSSAS